MIEVIEVAEGDDIFYGPQQDFHPEDDALFSLVGTMLGYAIKDGATEIHVPVPSKLRPFSVFFRLREQADLHEQMRVPGYVWNAFRAHLEQRTDQNGTFSVHVADEKHYISLRYQIEMSIRRDTAGETIVLKLNGEFSHPHFPNNP